MSTLLMSLTVLLMSIVTLTNVLLMRSGERMRREAHERIMARKR